MDIERIGADPQDTLVERLGELDAVTQDVLIGVLAGLERPRWMFSAQQN
jgi:DNA-binding ferritin-like protein